MPPRRTVQRLGAAALFLFAFACQSKGPPTSGLLGSHAGFKKQDDDTLVQRRVSDEDFAHYQRVMLEPVLIYLHPESGERTIGPNDQQRLREMFNDALLKELEARFEVVRDPGASAENVLLVRAAITNVRPGEPAAPGAEGVQADVGDGTVEVELLDSSSRERLLAVVSTKKARRVGTTPQEREQEAAYVMELWASALGDYLDEVMGR